MNEPKTLSGFDEPLSAFLDGEASAQEVHAVLDRLRCEPALRAVVDRHHRLRAQLRGELNPALGDGFVQRVMDRLDEPRTRVIPLVAPLQAPRRLKPWMRASLGLAMAASVSAVTVLSVPLLMPSGDPGFPALTARLADRSVQGHHWNDLSPDAAAELNNYLISHNNSAMDHGLSGTMGFMRVAADERLDFEGSGR